MEERIPFSTNIRMVFFLVLVLFVAVTVNEFLTDSGRKNDDIRIIKIDQANSIKEISRGNPLKKQVIFTFDGGSGIQSADSILETLKKHNVKGTFFLTGKFIDENPYLVMRIVSAGHEIFNHSYNHHHLTSLSRKEIIEELTKTENALRRIGGASTLPYFRPPFGDRDARVIKDAFSAGYQSVYWSVDAGDWQESEGRTAVEVKNKILSNVFPGAIYLMHLGDNITGEILDEIFLTIESRGYKIVSLTQGL